ncbi:nuclear transport factor 2 family protein [Nocardiopsis sp. MG754419]|uniref:nuclear transport factor 2 family protein n=1 Tax=Nocardiopsis sp. MG754419 TaxID=2259865 RepID=UPI001BACB21C|nr:nuclear transport factor 2 family protein [Nocardiopsis sp. MG754419]MBR8742683.1 nuclear transport factor 2 family protein [Nocardiopsis sp. MG754419]
MDASTIFHIHQFYARQSHLIDSGRAEEWAGTFTAGGAFHSPTYPAPVVGSADLTDFAAGFHRRATEQGEVHRHVVTNVWVRPEEETPADGVIVEAYLQVLATEVGGATRILRMTTLLDHLVVSEGRWSVARREVRRDDSPA